VNSRSARFREQGLGGALLAPLAGVIYAIALVLGLLIAAWCVDWIFVFHVWPDGIERLRAILGEDLARAKMQSGEVLGMSEWPVHCANALYSLLFDSSGIHAMALRFAEGAPLSIPDTIARNTYVTNHEAIQVAMVGTQLFGVRAVMVLLMLPTWFAAYALGLVDGLVLRSIRKARAGHESSSLYHRAKSAQIALIAVIIAVTLLLPLPLDPRWLCGPGAIGFALLARLQWMYYKKHF
jgi:integrating conjugative element membrane protein (TIGR03747 family)